MRSNKLTAAAFMATFSSAGRGDGTLGSAGELWGPKLCCNCKLNRARWDSIYCSDHCKQQFHDSLKEGK